MAINSYFQNIANAIRTKSGGSGLITPANMPQEILNIPAGGSSGFDFSKVTYLAFIVNALRSSDSYIQLAELDFFDSSNNNIIINTNNCTFSAINGTPITSSSQSLDKMWTSGSNTAHNKSIIQKTNTSYNYYAFECKPSYEVDLSDMAGWKWYTAEDSSTRDPFTFSVILGNTINGKIQKLLLDTVYNVNITSARNALAFERSF